uniref:Glycosyltransferase n=1 Tax=Kalanchoe fedtschenkoi TaxID=63787 RepID=A0A7N1A7N1_KALFE
MVEDHKHLHVAMFPWFAMGHLTAYMHFSNKLAERGHRVSFLTPSKPHPLISTLNAHPHLITLIHVPIPQVPGLDPSIETTADFTDFHTEHNLLATAFDRTASFIDSFLHESKPDVVFHDFSHWLPQIARTNKTLAVAFFTFSSASLAHAVIPKENKKDLSNPDRVLRLPPDFPGASVTLRKHEVRQAVSFFKEGFGDGRSLHERILNVVMSSDAVAIKTCRELEGHYLDYIEKHSNKVVLTAGPTLPVPPTAPLEEGVATWLGKFRPKSVIFCAFGSQCVLPLDQFQELVLGIELTGLPFLMALKPPAEAESLEAALPEGFKQRTEDRGMVIGEWVQQQQILGHESVGCFVTHCGSGSLTEGLISECQLVLLPFMGDQYVNARVMGEDLRVGVEVEKGDEDGLFDRQGVCKAVKQVMDMEAGVGKEVKINHDKWRNVLLTPGLEKSCVDEMVEKLKELLPVKV